MSVPEYNPNVPQRNTDSFAQSQPELLANFGVLYDRFAVNHVPLDAVTQAGNHNLAELLEQTESIDTGVSEISAYTKLIEKQTDQIFLRYQGNGQEFAYTTYQIYSIKPSKTLTLYFTFLPGNLMVYFGYFTPPGGNVFVFDLSPPVAKNIISISLCPKGTDPAIPKSIVKVLAQENGYFTKIQVGQVFGGLKVTPSYFFIMANL